MAKKKGSKAGASDVPAGMYKHAKSGQIIPIGKSVNKAGQVIDKKVVDNSFSVGSLLNKRRSEISVGFSSINSVDESNFFVVTLDPSNWTNP